MVVAAGNLDALLGLAVPETNLSGVAAVVSYTTAGSDALGSALDEHIATATVDTTSPGVYGGLPHNLSASLTVIAVNDAENTITLGLPGDNPINITPDFVLAYSQNALLLGGDTSFVTSIDLDFDSKFNIPKTTIDNTLTVMSTTELASGTAVSFSASGSFTGSTAPPTPGLAVVDTTTGQSVPATVQPYTGPVSGLSSEYINITTDSLNISVSTPNWFLHSGSGNDALAVSSGTNVLDGGIGSNFLTGGSGTDTFFVDDRGPTADIWSTVNNFHSGDAATIWGVTPGDFTLSWVDGQGATGFTGLTLHATASGVPTASLTLAGYTSADLSEGRLSVSFGTVGGSAYMYVHGNS